MDIFTNKYRAAFVSHPFGVTEVHVSNDDSPLAKYGNYLDVTVKIYNNTIFLYHHNKLVVASSNFSFKYVEKW